MVADFFLFLSLRAKSNGAWQSSCHAEPVEAHFTDIQKKHCRERGIRTPGLITKFKVAAGGSAIAIRRTRP